METLDNKRARLRREVRHAHNDWMQASEGHSGPPAASQMGDKWFDYLAAKQRLVAAYAEQPPVP